jgi:ABC-type multidrug transport system fused ATPase/permease subunit
LELRTIKGKLEIVGVLKRCLSLLGIRDRKLLLLIVFAQTLLNFLDLFGVLLIGLLSSTIIQASTSQTSTSTIAIIDKLGLSSLDLKTQSIYLATMAIVLLVGKTILSIFLTRKVIFFLSRRGSIISASLVSKLVGQSLSVIQKRTSQEIIFSVTTGIDVIMLKILATAVTILSDVTLLIIMITGLVFLDPLVAISTIALYFLIGFLLYHFMSVRASFLGQASSGFEIQSNEKIYEVLSSYRELVVRNRRRFYSSEIGALRMKLADVTAEVNFQPFISKYVIEVAVIIGAVLLAGTQFLLFDVAQAVSTLSVFLVAGTRIAPAVLRIQQGALLIKGSTGRAYPSFKLIDELWATPDPGPENDKINFDHSDFSPVFELKNVTFTYPGALRPALDNVSLSGSAGELIAIVGGTGAGKTTLVDVLLGLFETEKGEVIISGVPPLLAFEKWPGAVAYVPQETEVSNGTIGQNVSLGFPLESDSEKRINVAIDAAQLTDFVATLPDGLNARVGERGGYLSGGQRQRLGIARAMFTFPKLLILDEATSSLDAETELAISNAIQQLRGSMTIVMIAHRLSTVRNADVVVYLNKGKIEAVGSFTEVRKLIPNFNEQAKLMGL